MFLAHTSDVGPDYNLPLSQFGYKKVLSNIGGQFKLVNNICPHQSSLILKDLQKDFRCQYHGWSWDKNGNPTSSGSTSVCNNYPLTQNDVYIQNNLVFSNDIDISLPLDFSNHSLKEKRVDRVQASYKKIVDVFLDVDHIPVVHEGVYDVIDIVSTGQIKWKYHDWGSVQEVMSTENNSLAAAWITIYPYTMIEYQPGALFVTVCNPVSPDLTDVSVFKYSDNEEKWLLNENIWETAWRQDRHQSESLTYFTEFLPHLEESKRHFRKWLKEKRL